MKFLILSLILLSAQVFAKSSNYEEFEEYVQFIKKLARDPLIARETQTQKGGPQGQGEPGFNCPDHTSPQVPTSAHAVRPGDFKVIAALGDSITAGNGADASNILGVIRQTRGKVFAAGGDADINTHVTLTNILRVFNPDLKGQSFGTGDQDDFEKSQFNVAVPGARADDMLDQAQVLVQRMQDHPEMVNIQEDWKLINLFIGGNDLCRTCENSQTPEVFVNDIRSAVLYLREHLPRTVVNVLNIPRFDMLVEVFRSNFVCRIAVGQLCDCAFSQSNEEHAATSIVYQEAVKTLENGEFDTTEDFTLVIQEIINDSVEPPKKPDGDIDRSPFAPDCFHLSTKGHEIVGRGVWNNMLEPVGQKKKDYDLSVPDTPLNCPDSACPFIRTTRNSVNC